MLFLFKAVIAGLIIAFASWLAGRSPIAAGILVALPLLSILSIIFSYLEYRDMQKINQFAVSILVSVPLSLVFFIPFVLNRWLKMGFAPTFLSALGCLAAAYLLQVSVLKGLISKF